MAEEYCIVYEYHSFFTHLSTDGHVVCFHTLAMVNSAAMNTVCVFAQSVSDSLRPHGWQPTRLLCPWDFPDKTTGVGCHSCPRGSSWHRDQTCYKHWVRVSLQISVFVFLDKYPSTELLDHVSSIFSCFQEPPYCFPQ